MAANVSLDDLINSLDKQIRNLLYEDTRKILDERPTVLDISYSSLKVNNQKNYTEAEFSQIHNTLLSVVREKAQRKYKSIEDIPRGYFQGSTPYIVYVDGGPDVQLLIAKSFGGIRTFVTDKISKDPKLVDSIFGLRTEETPILNKKGIPSGDVKVKKITKIELGHIATESEIGALTSPLAYKLAGLIDYGALSNPAVEELAKDALNKVFEIQADVDYSFKNMAPSAIKSTESLLGEFFVVVTLHTRDLNQQFSEKEKTIFNELRQKIALLANKELRTKYLIQNISGSNTLAQDIEQALVQLIKTGKVNLNKHIPRSKSTPRKQVNKNKPVTSSGKITTSSNIPNKVKTPSVSLIDLQLIINLQLQDVISANMGDGSSKNILNYRTGRFAASAKVERLTQSREGTITAFYNYMRNPYGTFSQGGRQQNPRSRDPKLLIANSIRQIAETVVTNRMRAVLV
jgi:hypothetical protein